MILRNRGAGPFGLLTLVDERCGGEFVKAIHKALGVPYQEAESTPKEVIERVTEVLLPLLPTLQEREVS